VENLREEERKEFDNVKEFSKTKKFYANGKKTKSDELLKMQEVETKRK